MSHTIQPYNFDELELFEMPFRYKGVDYIMREASTEAARLYRNKMANAARWTPDGKFKSMGNVADVEAFLISMCVFCKSKIKSKGGEEKEVEVAVPETTIKQWPSKMTKKIFTDILKVSELQTEDTEEYLETEIADLQERLAKLKARRESPDTEDPAKNELGLSTDTSE